VLNNRGDFRKLWFGQTVSLLGDRVSRLALPTVALLVLHGTALDVGILGSLRFLPYIVLGPVAGVLADRMPKRSLMITADVGRLIVTATVPLAFAIGFLSLPLLFIVAGLTGCLTVLFQTSYQAYLPSLVGRDGLVEGNQKLQLSGAASEVAGASAGGILIQVLGSATAILVDAGSFAVSVLGLVAIKRREEPKPRPAGQQAGALAEARSGLRVLLGDRRLRAMMFSTATANVGVSAAGALVLVYCYDRAHLHPGEVGLAFGVGGAGLIAGAAIAPRLARIVPLGRLIIISGVVTGGSFLLIPAAGVSHALAALIVAEFFFGADMVYSIHLLSLVQAITPAELMGRIGGSALTVVWGSGTFGSLLGGVLGARAGVVPGLYVTGALTAAAALFLVFSPVRSIRELPASADAGAGVSLTPEPG
jgi:predicted MFS family arabinose efflux permease